MTLDDPCRPTNGQEAQTCMSQSIAVGVCPLGDRGSAARLRKRSALEGQLAVRPLDILLAGIVGDAQRLPGVQAACNVALPPLQGMPVMQQLGYQTLLPRLSRCFAGGTYSALHLRTFNVLFTTPSARTHCCLCAPRRAWHSRGPGFMKHGLDPKDATHQSSGITIAHKTKWWGGGQAEALEVGTRDRNHVGQAPTRCQLQDFNPSNASELNVMEIRLPLHSEQRTHWQFQQDKRCSTVSDLSPNIHLAEARLQQWKRITTSVMAACCPVLPSGHRPRSLKARSADEDSKIDGLLRPMVFLLAEGPCGVA